MSGEELVRRPATEITEFLPKLPRSGTNRGARARLLMATCELAKAMKFDFNGALKNHLDVVAFAQFNPYNTASRRAVPEDVRRLITTTYTRMEVCTSSIKVYYEYHGQVRSDNSPAGYSNRITIQVENLDPRNPREEQGYTIWGEYDEGDLSTILEINPAEMSSVVRRYSRYELVGRSDPNKLPDQPFIPRKIKPAVVEAIAQVITPTQVASSETDEMLSNLISPPRDHRRRFIPELIERWFPNRSLPIEYPALAILIKDPRFRI